MLQLHASVSVSCVCRVSLAPRRGPGSQGVGSCVGNPDCYIAAHFAIPPQFGVCTQMHIATGCILVSDSLLRRLLTAALCGHVWRCRSAPRVGARTQSGSDSHLDAHTATTVGTPNQMRVMHNMAPASTLHVRWLWQPLLALLLSLHLRLLTPLQSKQVRQHAPHHFMHGHLTRVACPSLGKVARGGHGVA